MRISAKYLCPVRGLAGLNPPEPVRLGQAAGVAKSLGLERLLVPVVEESLLGKARAKVDFLDGLVRALDRVADAGLQVWLIAPAQRILGLDWVPPYLVRALRDPDATPVFVDGRIRNLWPFNWWADPSVIQKRIMMFREVVSAAQGHPALTGWLIMARAGYDPREAIPFWARMAKDDKNGPPEILSTHPAPTSRIADIRDYLPEALQY
jgi:hypothetical protein